MSLEEAIRELTDAVKLNTAIMERIHNGEHRLKEVKQIVEKVIKNPEPESPNAQPKSTDTTSGQQSVPTGESSSQEQTPLAGGTRPFVKEGTDEELKAAHTAGAITYPYAVKPITIRLSKEKGREITIGVLSRFGVKSAQDLDATQWADYIAHCEKVLAGGEV